MDNVDTINKIDKVRIPHFSKVIQIKGFFAMDIVILFYGIKKIKKETFY